MTDLLLRSLSSLGLGIHLLFGGGEPWTEDEELGSSREELEDSNIQFSLPLALELARLSLLFSKRGLVMLHDGNEFMPSTRASRSTSSVA